jgi:hypothetical protein
MTPIRDTLNALARGIREGDAPELARRRAALEANLETMVRCALRNGSGAPGLVRWVRGTMPHVMGASIGEPGAERAAPVLARLLCRALVNEVRHLPTGVAMAGRDTVFG